MNRINDEDLTVMMIDEQVKLLPTIKERDALIKNSKLVLEVSKIFNTPLIVTEQYPKGLGATADDFKEYLDGAEVFAKTEFCGCTPPVLESLEKTGRKSVAIFGVETHVCVYQTVRELINRGYTVYVISDAVYSREETNRKAGLSLMKDFGAYIITAEILIFDILVKSGSKEFKHFSNLIK